MLRLLKSLRRRRNECKTVADMPFAEIKQCSGHYRIEKKTNDFPDVALAKAPESAAVEGLFPVTYSDCQYRITLNGGELTISNDVKTMWYWDAWTIATTARDLLEVGKGVVKAPSRIP
jgi:hypothetical protein